jgi:hypothetical protein
LNSLLKPNSKNIVFFNWDAREDRYTYHRMSYTVDQIIDAIVDNADWLEAASVTKAQAFATAVVRWMALSPESTSDQGSSMTLGRDQLAEMRLEALRYISANTPNSSVRHLGIGGQFRR